MKWHHDGAALVFIAGIAGIFAGCQSDTTQPTEPSGSTTQQTSENAQPGIGTSTAADSGDREVLVSEGNPPIMPEILVPDEWLRPIDEQESFFAPPPTEVSVKEKPAPRTHYENVRLLGFAVSLENPDLRKAILKIGDAMYFVAAGETQAGVKVLGMNRYTVHLERDGERWSLALLDQPIVNAPVIPELRPHRSTSTSNTSRSSMSHLPANSEERAETIPGMPELPDALEMPSPPGVGDNEEGMPGLPGLDDGMKLPGLPGMEEGNSGVPQLPGMGDAESGLPDLPELSSDLPGANGSSGLPTGTSFDSSPGGMGPGLPEGPSSP